MRCIEARYADSAAMSLALLASLRFPSGEALFADPAAARYWTEHSDRASVISIAATMPDVDAAWLDDLGRWSRGSSAAYVRTQLFRVRTIQVKVARWARSQENVHSVEEELYAGLGAFLLKQGWGPEYTVHKFCCSQSFCLRHELPRQLSNK